MEGENQCGVCNNFILNKNAQIMRKESDGSFTHYHSVCEYRAAKLNPCEDCGYHKAFCNECMVPEKEVAHEE